MCRSVAAVAPIKPVRSVGDGEEAFVVRGEPRQRRAEIVRAGAAGERLRRGDHVRAERQQRIVRRGRQIEIDDAAECCALWPRARSAATNSGKRLSIRTASACATRAAASRGRAPLSPWPRRVAMDLFAAGVEQDERDRRAGAGHALDAAAIDAFGRKVGDDAGADRVVLAAERAGKARVAAEARDRHRRVGGAAAAGDDEVRRRHFGAGRRKVLDPHHDVLHRDAGAQNPGGFSSRMIFGNRLPLFGFMLVKAALAVDPGADDVMRDRDRRRRGEAVRVLARQHGDDLVAVEPARVFQLRRGRR